MMSHHLHGVVKDYNTAFASFKTRLKVLWYLLMDGEYLEKGEMKKFDKIYLSMLANFVAGDHALDGRKSLAGRLLIQSLEDIYFQNIVRWSVRPSRWTKMRASSTCF